MHPASAQVGQQPGGEGPEGRGGRPRAVVGVDVEEESGALVEGLRVFGVQLAVGEEHDVLVPAPALAQMRVGRVGVRVDVARGRGEEEVIVNLEAELGGEGEEGEGSSGTVGARHIGSVGFGSIAWLGWWEAWSTEDGGVRCEV